MEQIKLPRELGFSLEASRILQVESSVLVFKFGQPMKVYRLDQLWTGRPKAKALPELSRKVFQCAIALFKSKLVILTGGSPKDKTVSVFEL